MISNIPSSSSASLRLLVREFDARTRKPNPVSEAAAPLLRHPKDDTPRLLAEDAARDYILGRDEKLHEVKPEGVGFGTLIATI